jgi:hypothetical protein
MKTFNTMTTLTEVLEDLRVKKMDTEFRWTNEGFTAGTEKRYLPHNLVITETYRFDGMSNPSDMCILYIIKSSDGIIGYSLDSYGTYSNHEKGYYDFMKEVPILRQNGK